MGQSGDILVSREPQFVKFRLLIRASAINGALIAIILASGAQAVQAGLPDCKLSDAQVVLGFQGADYDPIFALYNGEIQAEQGYWDADIKDQEQVFNASGGTPNVYFAAAMSLSTAYWHEGKYAPAIAAANTALSTHVDDSLAYTQRAYMEFENVNFGGAISDATEAIAINPCQKGAYKTRALAYRREDLDQQALADEADIIDIDTDFIAQQPKTPGSYVARGLDEDDQGNHDRAIADFSMAISLNPKADIAFEDRGISYEAEGRYVDDVSDESESVTLNPKNASAWNNLCWGLAVTGDLDDAMSSCDQALLLAPRNIHAWDSLGFVDLKMKNYTQAVADYGTGLKIEPEFASSLFGRGLAERNLGNNSASAYDIAKAEKNDPDVVSEYATYGFKP
jgi:tetratricopeptide (TPR) repeat protein